MAQTDNHDRAPLPRRQLLTLFVGLLLSMLLAALDSTIVATALPTIVGVAGPLLGGFFSSQLSWRWIFYINLPLGAAALVVIATALPSRPDRVHHSMDYLGATLLAMTLGTLALVTDLGGLSFTWSSPLIPALAAIALVSFGGFLAVETRAPEPILPLRLFRDRTFAVVSLIGVSVGFACSDP